MKNLARTLSLFSVFSENYLDKSRGFVYVFVYVKPLVIRVHAHVCDHTAIKHNDVLIGYVVLSLSARVSDIDFNSLGVGVSSRT